MEPTVLLQCKTGWYGLWNTDVEGKVLLCWGNHIVSARLGHAEMEERTVYKTAYSSLVCQTFTGLWPTKSKKVLAWPPPGSVSTLRSSIRTHLAFTPWLPARSSMVPLTAACTRSGPEGMPGYPERVKSVTQPSLLAWKRSP
jgi:hypothetical protein